jgi:hypothetical protein
VDVGTALATAPPNPPFPAAALREHGVALDEQTLKRYEERLASLRAEVQRMQGLLAEDAGKPRQPRKRFPALIEKHEKEIAEIRDAMARHRAQQAKQNDDARRVAGSEARLIPSAQVEESTRLIDRQHGEF